MSISLLSCLHFHKALYAVARAVSETFKHTECYYYSHENSNSSHWYLGFVQKTTILDYIIANYDNCENNMNYAGGQFSIP